MSQNLPERTLQLLSSLLVNQNAHFKELEWILILQYNNSLRAPWKSRAKIEPKLKRGSKESWIKPNRHNCKLLIVTPLIIKTKKLLNPDWLRKECSSSVTRVQTCNTSVKLVTQVQITNGFWLAETHKRNHQEPIRF